MDKKKILYISNEIMPFVSETAMSRSCRELLLSMQDGHEIRAFMPKWGNINERRNQLHEVIRLSGMNLMIDDTDHPLIIKVASMPSARLQVYFIDNDDYFQNRLAAKDKDGNEYPDNDERTIFFARGVLETVKKLRWNPDIIHCHGWLSALVPLYLKTAYKEEPAFRESKIVTTIYPNELDLPFKENFEQLLMLRGMEPGDGGVFNQPFSNTDLQKKAIEYSDGIIFSSGLTDGSLKEYAASVGRLSIESTADTDAARLDSFYDSLE